MYDQKTDTYTEDFLTDLQPVSIGIDRIPGVTEHKIDGNISVDGILTTDNTTAYTPTTDYNPASKKYVDDAIDSVIAMIP